MGGGAGSEPGISKGRPSGEQPAGPGDRKEAGRQGFLIDLQLAETPGAEAQGFQVEPEQALDEAVLPLQVLRRQQSPFLPHNRLQPLHITNKGTRISAGRKL